MSRFARPAYARVDGASPSARAGSSGVNRPTRVLESVYSLYRPSVPSAATSSVICTRVLMRPRIHAALSSSSTRTRDGDAAASAASAASHAQGTQSATHSYVYVHDVESYVVAAQLRPFVSASCAVSGHAPGSTLRV